MKILVIGSQGFIGSACVKYFKNKHNVWECDIHEKDKNSNYIQIDPQNPNFDTIFDNADFELCINASGSASVAKSIVDPYTDFELNVKNVTIILDSLRKYSPNCRFINFSSAAVYGDTGDHFIEEDQTITPISPYGYNKAASEMVCKMYSDIYNLKISVIRFFSIYGEGLKKQLLWDAAKKISADKKSAVFFGTGVETRDWLHVDDAVALIEIIAIKNNSGFEIYNGGTGISHTSSFVINLLREKLNIKKEIVFDNIVRDGDPTHYLASIDKAEKLGWKVKISLNEGIKRYCSWIESLKEKGIE